MVIQGSNNPFVVRFDSSIESIPVLVITLWHDVPSLQARLLKKWEREDMEVTNDTVICPVTEAETKAFPSSHLVLEAKGLNENGETIFWNAYKIDVLSRRDKIIALTQTGG